MEQKQVLVICSSPDGLDFNRPQNQNLKVIFGDNPIYTFCDGRINRFPNCHNTITNYYDFIWFAGCNNLVNIFSYYDNYKYKQTILKLLKQQGIIIFTEGEGYIKNFWPSKSLESLTLAIENLIESTNKYYLREVDPNFIIKNITDFFTENFMVKIENNHILYQRKNTGLKKYLKYKKKYLQLKNKNFNL